MRRMLPLKEAAFYVGIPAVRFPAECEVRPVAMPHGKKLYDVRDLDDWIDRVKGANLDEDSMIARLR